MKIGKFLLFFFFVLFCFVCAGKNLSAQGKILVDCVLAEVNGEAIKLSDLHFEEQLRRLMPQSGVEVEFKEDLLCQMVYEKILAQRGSQEMEKEIIGRIKGIEDNFSLTDMPSEKIISAFKKLISSEKLTDEEKTQFEKKFKKWEENLICDIFFPGEPYILRGKDSRKLIFSLADQLNVTPAFLKEKLLQKAFVKKALGKLDEKVKNICVSPREIKNYYAQYPLFSTEFQYAVVEKKDGAISILEKLSANKDSQIINMNISGFEIAGRDLESLIPEFREGMRRVLDRNLTMGYVVTDIGYFVIQVKKNSFEEKQEEISEKIREEKIGEVRRIFFDDLYSESVIVKRG